MKGLTFIKFVILDP